MTSAIYGMCINRIDRPSIEANMQFSAAQFI